MIAAAALGTSCFNGSDALGLPCVADDDCGEGQRCIEEICGGPAATTGVTTTGVSSSGVADSSTGEGSDSSAGSTGPIAECGNGIMEDGEECDAGPMGDASCDSDCTPAVCGDGFVNVEALEECDDSNNNPLDNCSQNCRETLFWDDMEQLVISMAKWEREQPVYAGENGDFMLDSGWEYGLPAMPAAGVWHSGDYHSSSGVARLATVPINFPALPPGYHFELQFQHSVRTDGNPDDLGVGDCTVEQNSDGGVIWLQDVAGNNPLLVGPAMGQGVQLTDAGCSDVAGGELNPLFAQEDPPTPPVYAGKFGQTGLIDERLPLPAQPNTIARVIFDMSYDCSNCWQNMPPFGTAPPPGWVIDNVAISAVPDGP